MSKKFEDVRMVSVDGADVDSVVAQSRAKLLASMASPRTAPIAKKTAMWWGIGGGIGLVAAATTTAIVLSPLGVQAPVIIASPGPTAVSTPSTQTPGPVPSATAPVPANPTAPAMTLQDVLAQAASSAAAQPDLAEGQFWKMSSIQTRLRTFAFAPEGSTSPSGTPAQAAQNVTLDVDRDVAVGAFETRSEAHYFFPADTTQDSLTETFPQPALGRTWGAETDALQDELAALLPQRAHSVSVDYRYPEYRNADAAYYYLAGVPMDQLPRDPAELYQLMVDQIAAATPEESTRSGLLESRLHDALVQNVGPQDLRATVLQAAGMLPGVELVSVEGNYATLTWPRNASLNPSQLTLDVSSGYITGETEWGEGRDGVVPSDVPNWHTDITVTVVYEAPATTR